MRVEMLAYVNRAAKGGGAKESGRKRREEGWRGTRGQRPELFPLAKGEALFVSVALSQFLRPIRVFVFVALNRAVLRRALPLLPRYISFELPPSLPFPNATPRLSKGRPTKLISIVFARNAHLELDFPSFRRFFRYAIVHGRVHATRPSFFLDVIGRIKGKQDYVILPCKDESVRATVVERNFDPARK